MPPPDWLEGPAELGISGIVPIIYKGGKEEAKSAGRLKKKRKKRKGRRREVRRHWRFVTLLMIGAAVHLFLDFLPL